jgi:hypothetical protein
MAVLHKAIVLDSVAATLNKTTLVTFLTWCRNWKLRSCCDCRKWWPATLIFTDVRHGHTLQLFEITKLQNGLTVKVDWKINNSEYRAQFLVEHLEQL